MLSFTYPVLLWGLVGLSLPILAHMVHRHTTRRLNFPSLRFIRISQIPRKGRNWPTDILLLLMRLLLAACAILCLA
ncbi:MAG: BatA domain-containing protein, partial [Opitutae bacterium]